jgi:membrane protein insertase Oxa1/YidC/SpoIIIJ
VVSSMLAIAIYAKAAKQAVNVYWLTSNLFSIVQNLCIGYADKQRHRNL